MKKRAATISSLVLLIVGLLILTSYLVMTPPVSHQSSMKNYGESTNTNVVDVIEPNTQEPVTSPGSGTRGDYTESEPNNDFSEADDISAISKPINLNGRLSTIPDIDTSKIWLDGEDKPVGNLTVKLTNVYSADWQTGYYSTFIISIYGKFEKEYLLMKVVSTSVYTWNDESDCEPATIHGFNTGDYYIRVSSFRSSTWADDPIDYTLQITTGSATPEDDNQVPQFADELIGTITNKKVTMSTNIFDWYYFDSPDPEDYEGEYSEVNFSISVKIVDCKEMQTQNINNQPISFVTEVHVLIYHEIANNYFKGEEIVGNKNKKYGQDNPIEFHKWTSETRTYIGIYVQRYGKTNDGQGEFLLGDGFCDGWAQYKIEKIQAKPIIRPTLSDAKVTLPVGKIYHTYTYTVTYSDENNDRPRKISITIDGGNTVFKAPMTKVDDSDKTYDDGCIYQYILDGNEFDPDREVHEYSIYAEDIEISIKRNLQGDGPIITENILPNVRPSASMTYTLYEDDPISYLDLNTTFEDPDNNTLYYRLSDGVHNWSGIYNSENISIKVATLLDDEGNANQYLEFRPKENMFNRLAGQDFGSEIVYINISDEDPSQEGGINRAHYIWPPFELELIILGVNDPPQSKSSFGYHFQNGELVLKEDIGYYGFNLYDIFWDPIEDDPLTFSVRDNKNIDVRFYSNGTADIIPKENWTGTESFEFIADDSEATIEDTLKVKVLAVNDNPHLNYTPKQILHEGEWFNITFIGYDLADNEPVYFITNLMFELDLSDDEYIFDPDTGELKFKPINKNVGTYKNINITVKDYNGGWTTQIMVFEILNSPDPPVPEIFSPAPGQRFLSSELIDFQSYYYDPDDEILIEEHTFRWHSSLDGNLSENNNFRHTLSEGEHVITLTVSDPVLIGSKEIQIRVVSESDRDIDEDGIPDYWEILYSLNEFDPRDAQQDPDVDTYTNLEEYLGLDGNAGNNDDTDPWDPDMHPAKHFTKSAEKDNWLLLGGSVTLAVVLIILISLFIIIRHRKRQKAKREEDEVKAKDEEKPIWQDTFGRKYKVYQYKSTYIICNNCLEKLEIELPIRPLVVTCTKCNKRGVLYK